MPKISISVEPIINKASQNAYDLLHEYLGEFDSKIAENSIYHAPERCFAYGQALQALTDYQALRRMLHLNHKDVDLMLSDLSRTDIIGDSSDSVNYSSNYKYAKKTMSLFKASKETPYNVEDTEF